MVTKRTMEDLWKTGYRLWSSPKTRGAKSSPSFDDAILSLSLPRALSDRCNAAYNFERFCASA